MSGTLGTIAAMFIEAGVTLQEAEDMVRREVIRAALAKTKGNQVKAAVLLRIHRNTLIRLLRKYGFAKKYLGTNRPDVRHFRKVAGMGMANKEALSLR